MNHVYPIPVVIIVADFPSQNLRKSIIWAIQWLATSIKLNGTITYHSCTNNLADNFAEKQMEQQQKKTMHLKILEPILLNSSHHACKFERNTEKLNKKGSKLAIPQTIFLKEVYPVIENKEF